ncbi:MAG: hypothetical protein LBN21_08975, partial [Treponema sp.]|nr:hypothetical protein [Treponema sp.]
RPRGFAFIPTGDYNRNHYRTGGGGDLLFDIDLSGINPEVLPGLGYSAGLEMGGQFLGFAGGAEGNLQLYSLGPELRLFYYPLSRLMVSAEGALGVYTGIAGDGSSTGFWWRAGAEAGFRFSPAFTLSANAGYKKYENSYGVDPLGGMYLGLTGIIVFETRSGNADIELAVVRDENVFPVFLQLYQQNPAALLQITNRESAEIRNVRVSFRAGEFTSSEFDCGTIPLLAKGRSAEVPLLADFSPAVLNFTGEGRITGELVLKYTLLGAERQTIHSVAVPVHNRNAFRPGDARALAAFVSPTSPEVLEFSKYILGLARKNFKTGLNQNMQTAVWLFEGLRQGGIKVNDGGRNGAGTSDLGEIQFPAETLGYRTGSAVDTGLLYAAALEASGVRAAVIRLENEAITAISMGINGNAALSNFNGNERILIINDEVWVPLAMSALPQGFTSAWDKGLTHLNRVFSNNEAVDFVILEDAWAVYPSAPLPSQGIQVRAPGETVTAAAANTAINAYITRELRPAITAVSAEIRRSPTPELYNRLGLLYMRAAQNADAKSNFERAAGMGSVAAMNNRGNIALAEKDSSAAERWFRQALAKEPENRAALNGLERAKNAAQ